MIVCTYCNKSKPEESFYLKLGKRRTICINCFKDDVRTRRQSEAGRVYLRAYSKKRYLKHRRKNLARSKLNAAVASGIVKKPSVCESCSEELNLQGHHDDYDKPLEVTWLCDTCHKIKHHRIVDKALLQSKIPKEVT